MKGREKYNCEDCCGTGKGVCSCCESEIICECCDGYGLNLDVVDAKAFYAACDMMKSDMSSELKVGGEYVGRVGWNKDRKEVWRLLYADFPAKKGCQ